MLTKKQLQEQIESLNKLCIRLNEDINSNVYSYHDYGDVKKFQGGIRQTLFYLDTYLNELLEKVNLLTDHFGLEFTKKPATQSELIIKKKETKSPTPSLTPTELIDRKKELRRV